GVSLTQICQWEPMLYYNFYNWPNFIWSGSSSLTNVEADVFGTCALIDWISYKQMHTKIKRDQIQNILNCQGIKDLFLRNLTPRTLTGFNLQSDADHVNSIVQEKLNFFYRKVIHLFRLQQCETARYLKQNPVILLLVLGYAAQDMTL
ncbi:hypothetical protein ACJX0J_019950, partial [Zea mays]